MAVSFMIIRFRIKNYFIAKFMNKHTENPLGEIMWMLKSHTEWSMKELSATLNSSDTTVFNVMHGQNSGLEHYKDITKLLLYSFDWTTDFSELPEVLECALENDFPIIAGVYDPDKKEIMMQRFIMMKEKL